MRFSWLLGDYGSGRKAGKEGWSYGGACYEASKDMFCAAVRFVCWFSFLFEHNFLFLFLPFYFSLTYPIVYCGLFRGFLSNFNFFQILIFVYSSEHLITLFSFVLPDLIVGSLSLFHIYWCSWAFMSCKTEQIFNHALAIEFRRIGQHHKTVETVLVVFEMFLVVNF